MPELLDEIPMPADPVSAEEAGPHLAEFLGWVESFLEFVSENSGFNGILSDLFDGDLISRLPLALREVRETGVFERAKRLAVEVRAADVIDHGLFGAQLQWKLANTKSALGDFLAVLTGEGTGPLSRVFDRLVKVIDALLDSILDAIKAGGAIKELKEAVRWSVKLVDLP